MKEKVKKKKEQTINTTLNASSSVRSSPIYIGSTSSQLFSPEKQYD